MLSVTGAGIEEKKLSRETDFDDRDASIGTPFRIDRERLRRVLAVLPDDAMYGDDAAMALENPVPAAVLFPIVLREGGPTVLLTQRTEHLRDHAGQISFPGGRAEFADNSPIVTALREAQEEIGLAAAQVDVVGTLPPYLTVTGYRITPVVGLLTPPLSFHPDPSEVAEVFEVPFSFLMDPANHQRRSREVNGKARHFFAIPYGRYFIWGATAGIIVGLARALAD